MRGTEIPRILMFFGSWGTGFNFGDYGRFELKMRATGKGRKKRKRTTSKDDYTEDDAWVGSAGAMSA